MATAPTNYINKIKVGTTDHQLAAYYLMDGTAFKDWSDITSLITAAKLPISVVSTLPTASASTLGTIYLKPETPISGTYVEYITVDNGSSANPRYTWEQIGTSTTDLSAYAKRVLILVQLLYLTIKLMLILVLRVSLLFLVVTLPLLVLL